jgi:hypothetical protein
MRILLRDPNFVVVIFRIYIANPQHHASYNFPDIMVASSIVTANYKLSVQ